MPFAPRLEKLDSLLLKTKMRGLLGFRKNQFRPDALHCGDVQCLVLYVAYYSPFLQVSPLPNLNLSLKGNNKLHSSFELQIDIGLAIVQKIAGSWYLPSLFMDCFHL
jgi:hypothetical protein